jgi:hypothetical protein
MNRPMVRLALRAVAILIAVLAVIDPAMTSMRASKPRLSVVAADRVHDSALAQRTAKSLEKRFTVIEAPLSATDATVLVGETLPAAFRELSTPLFVVRDDSVSNRVRIETVKVPQTSPLDARVPVTIVVRTFGVRGPALDVSLSSGGAIVDRMTRSIASDRSQFTLSFAPTAVGAAALRVTARLAGARDSATADVVTDVRPTRWSVLFFDPRPSWLSTFVRRAVERDPRFLVTSRVVTSRNVSTDAGNPPSALDDLASTSRFDAIVVSAPDALLDREIAGLEDYARRRAGTVVLLCDAPAPGKVSRLTGVMQWAMQRRRVPAPIVARAPGSLTTDTLLLASEIAWAMPMPRTADILARTAAVGDSTANRAVLWRVPLGAGRVVVSSALDAWRFRDRGQSRFDKLWQTVLADASAASPPAVQVRVSPAPVLPGEDVDVDVVLRDPALRDLASARDTLRASITAQIVGAKGSRTPIRLWPTATVGEFHTTLRAPHDTGAYRVVATSDGLSADASLIVADNASHATPSDIDILETLAASRGGKVVSAGALDRLPSIVSSVVHAAPRLETWHPMRSTLWIVPFVLSLGAEWLLRRRAGLS